MIRNLILILNAAAAGAFRGAQAPPSPFDRSKITKLRAMPQPEPKKGVVGASAGEFPWGADVEEAVSIAEQELTKKARWFAKDFVVLPGRCRENYADVPVYREEPLTLEDCLRDCWKEYACDGFTLVPPVLGGVCQFTKGEIVTGSLADGSGKNCYIKKCSWKGGNITHVTAMGDPHLRNIKGENFDVQVPGTHELIVLPRKAAKEQARLHVEADVTEYNARCPRSLYMTAIRVTGSLLGPLKNLHFFTRTHEFDTPATIGLSIGNSKNISVEEFKSRIPSKMGSVKRVHPDHKDGHHFYSTLIVRLTLGAVKLDIGFKHTQEPDVNWLWVTAGGWADKKDLGLIKAGGLLGTDSHKKVEKRPKCTEGRWMDPSKHRNKTRSATPHDETYIETHIETHNEK